MWRTASDDRRRSHRRLLESGWREKTEHATHNVREVVMTIARMLDRILAASVSAPFEQTKLASEASVIGQPRQTAREHRQAFEVDGAFRP